MATSATPRPTKIRVGNRHYWSRYHTPSAVRTPPLWPLTRAHADSIRVWPSQHDNRSPNLSDLRHTPFAMLPLSQYSTRPTSRLAPACTDPSPVARQRSCSTARSWYLRWCEGVCFMHAWGTSSTVSTERKSAQRDTENIRQDVLRTQCVQYMHAFCFVLYCVRGVASLDMCTQSCDEHTCTRCCGAYMRTLSHRDSVCFKELQDCCKMERLSSRCIKITYYENYCPYTCEGWYVRSLGSTYWNNLAPMHRACKDCEWTICYILDQELSTEEKSRWYGNPTISVTRYTCVPEKSQMFVGANFNTSYRRAFLSHNCTLCSATSRQKFTSKQVCVPKFLLGGWFAT